MAPFKSLRAWQVAHELAVAIARATHSFPPEERFELTSQLRRAAVSVPSNLAEGSGRYGQRDCLRFVRIAMASLAEVEYLLFFALEMRYLSADDHARLDTIRRHANALISRLARSLQEPRH